MNTSDGPVASSAIALREAFGDRKLPGISRKITACVACRKLKIRCHMDGGDPPCTRCKKRNLSCSVNKSLQMILENDLSWKEGVEQKIAGFEDALTKIADRISCPELLDLLHMPQTHNSDAASGRDDIIRQPSQLLTEATQPPEAWAVVNDPKSGPAVIPSTVVSQISPSIIPNEGQDIRDPVARGLIRLSTAELCFTTYKDRLDHFVYRVLDGHVTLASIRRSSPILTAAICAVGSLHASPEHFAVCYRAFVDLASAQMFSRRHSLDDIRALIIGAFWLHDISWTLIGAAVRVAIEMRLHRCVIKPQVSSRDWYLQTRLFCHVFVCDHHFSVAYGRPPLTPRDFDYPTVSNALMRCEYANEDDTRLLSQVEIWSISTKVYYKVGIDIDEPIPESSIPQLQRLSISLDTWRADWIDQFSSRDVIGHYPRKGVRLHYHFAKLYLCSHAFRGAQDPDTTTFTISPELEEMANAAVHHSTAILRTIIDDPEFQSFLDGLPAYFDTMIAFAVVFLVKVLARDSPAIRIDRTGTYDMMNRLSSTLEAITEHMSKHHLLASIASSLRSVIDKGRQKDTHTPTNIVLPPPAQTFPVGGELEHNPLVDNGDPYFIGNFDFFYPPLNEFDNTFMDYSRGG